MVSEKPWRPEAVLLLGAGMLVVLSLSVTAAALLKPEDAGPDFNGFFISTVITQCCAVVLIHFFLRAHGMAWGEFLGLRHRRIVLIVIMAIGFALLSLPVALLANQLSAKVITKIYGIPEQQIAVQVLEKTKDSAQRMIFALAAIIMAPLVEEIFFRGILYPLLKYRGYPRLAIWGTSLLFAAVHVNLMTFFPLFVFALLLVWIYERTDTLLAPIATHATFNTVNFVLFVNQSLINDWIERFK
jgi:membrane protease YdiL (CAAX protease family)